MKSAFGGLRHEIPRALCPDFHSVTLPFVVSQVRSRWHERPRGILEADDAIQEVCIRVWRDRGSLRARTVEGHLALLERKVAHALRDLERSPEARATASGGLVQSGDLARLDGPVDAEGCEPLVSDRALFEVIEKREQASILHQALKLLPKPEATVVILRYFEGHTIEKIARIVRATRTTVYERLQAAYEKLYSYLRLRPEYEEFFRT